MESLKEKFRKGGKKFIILWATWFIVKWTLVFTFGSSLVNWIW